MGSGKAGAATPQESNYAAGQAAAAGGIDRGAADPGHPEYAAWAAGFDAYAPPQPVSMPDFGTMFAPSGGDSFDYAAQLAQQQADAERAAGMGSLNQLASSRYDAATQATTDVNQQIAAEESHARLMGLDYSASEEQKLERINKLYSDYWGEASETELGGLVKKWGTGDTAYGLPEGIARIEGGDSQGALGDTSKAAGRKVQRAGTALTDEEDVLGGATTALGV